MDNNEQNNSNMINNEENFTNNQENENANIEENTQDNNAYSYGENTTSGSYSYGVDANTTSDSNSYSANMNNQYNVKSEKQKIDEKAHNFAIASLVLGIISIVLCCCCWGIITLGCGIAGIVLWYYAKDSEGNREGMAQAGMICSIVGIVLSVIVFLLVVVFGVLGSIADSL